MSAIVVDIPVVILRPGIDAEGKWLAFRAGDINARVLLMAAAEIFLEAEGEAIRGADRDAMCSLLHADAYLSDRLTYELYPWPKGQIKIHWGAA